MRVVLVGGGTGGHFYPLIAVSEALVENAALGNARLELYYIGPDPYDRTALDRLNIKFVYCPAGKRRRYRSFLNVLDLFRAGAGVVVALYKLFVLYPDVIMSKGGYTSVPVVIAGWLLRIPIVIHESDAVAGRANRLAARFARYIAISYDEAAKGFPADKVSLTGIPIRKALLLPPQGDAKESLGIDPELPLILILGGSLGAERVNNLVLESLDELLPKFSIIHQTGKSNYEAVRAAASALVSKNELASRYHPVPFIALETLNLAYHTAAIVISRSGSGTVFEIATHGKPSILIPIPEDVSHDQRSNAYAYARSGAATVIEEGNLRDGLLAGEIARMMDDRELYAEMASAALAFAPRDAAMKIASALRSIGNEHNAV